MNHNKTEQDNSNVSMEENVDVHETDSIDEKNNSIEVEEDTEETEAVCQEKIDWDKLRKIISSRPKTLDQSAKLTKVNTYLSK